MNAHVPRPPDEAARLRRLAEMGVDVYLPRAERRGGIAESAPAVASPPAAARVLVLAADAAPARLLADVVRALRLARIEAVEADPSDTAALAAAAGLVLFGDAPVRAAGAALPAQRQREIGWVATREPEALARDASAKRALWSELRRLARLLGATGARQ